MEIRLKHKRELQAQSGKAAVHGAFVRRTCDRERVSRWRKSRGRPRATEPVEPERFGLPDSVKECLEILVDVRNQERARGRHLDTKTASLLGFSAVTLTLNVTLGSSLLQRALSQTWHNVARYSFLVAVVSLGLGAVVAVVGVLRPVGRNDISEKGIDAYADRPKVITPPDDLRETWLQTVASVALDDRRGNNFKADVSAVAALLLAIGVLGIVGQATTLVFAHERPKGPSAASQRASAAKTRSHDHSRQVPKPG